MKLLLNIAILFMLGSTLVYGATSIHETDLPTDLCDEPSDPIED